MSEEAYTAQMKRAMAVLAQGGLVAIPTETVYGLAADARNEVAIQKVFDLKGRPAHKPLIVHLGSADQLVAWAQDIPSYARLWADAFWPGPLTLILNKHPSVLPIITGGQETVAVRVPDHPMTQALLQAWGGALVAPSANRYGQLSPTTAQAVSEAFGSDAPLVLDGGPCPVGIESTMVLCTGDQPVVVRPGMITAQMLEVVGGIQVKRSADNVSVEAPGQEASHYAPATPCYLWDRERDGDWQPGAQSVGFLGFERPSFETASFKSMPRNPTQAAQTLYESLRQLDAGGLALILVESVPPTEEWSAVADRLRRATKPMALVR